MASATTIRNAATANAIRTLARLQRAKGRAGGGAAPAENTRRNRGMKIQPVIIATTLAVLFTGCAGTSPTRLVGNTIGVAGGALLGSKFGKRNPLATAAGAVPVYSSASRSMPGAQPLQTYPAGYEKRTKRLVSGR